MDQSRSEQPQAPWPGRTRRLREGCYLLRYESTSRPHLDGTLRVHRQGNALVASGDLYVHALDNPDPAKGIPIFPIRAHRLYLQVTEILEADIPSTGVTIAFTRWALASESLTWTNHGTFTATLRWAPAPDGYPDPAQYLMGDVTHGDQTSAGTWTMGWVSDYLRRAVVEIDRTPFSELPIGSGDGVGWRTVFDQVGWDLTVEVSDDEVAEASGEFWSDAECHAAMLERRAQTDLDAEWRYHLLCIRRHEAPRVERGVMYDELTGDANQVPREGCAVCSHWPIPDAEPWGLVRGMRFGLATKVYFRTAVHEISHAMGLRHPNHNDDGIMTPTDAMAGRAVPPVQFPDNVVWSHSSRDQGRLRHFPDPVVRPGGIRMLLGAEFDTVPVSGEEMPPSSSALELVVVPVTETVPLGAPVRIDVELVNPSDEPAQVPAVIGLKGGFTSGTVTDDSLTAREFSSMIGCVDSHTLVALGAGERIRDSITLVRGARGPLFPNPGLHAVEVRIAWNVGDVPFEVSGSTLVDVTPAVDESHADAASKVFGTPDVLACLVVGGDHLHEGIEAIHTALRDPTLRSHFAYVEAKRVGERFRDRQGDLRRAAELLADQRCVMSAKERQKATVMLARAKVRSPGIDG